MPRIPRGQQPGLIFHLLNRGNGRATVFRDDHEYRQFLSLLVEARERAAVDIYAACVMPNHFHVVARAEQPGAISRMMQWWLTAHVRKHHQRHQTSGHVWQGRYLSIPIQGDEHLLTVLRYVLLNPCRASLASHPRDWPWSTLRYPGLAAPWPFPPPADFDAWLRRPLEQEKLESIRESIRRRRPFGDPAWQQEIGFREGLESTLRPRGRPRSRDSREGLLG